MEVKILWTDTALDQLEQIYDYYKFKASISVAKKLVKNIVSKSELLTKNPELGTKEPLLSKRTDNYRFLVEGNYKIIYTQRNNLVIVVSVFDCRQNPIKMALIKG